MAGDWIKIRRGLIDDPKLVACMEYLLGMPDFREWVTPGNSSWQVFPPSDDDGPTVTRNALRHVTLSLLCQVWGAAREHGCEENDDCFLPFIDIEGLDSLANAPCVGLAMASVGWAVLRKKPPGVILPKFFAEYNVAINKEANAERQYRHRLKKKLAKLSSEKQQPKPTEEKRYALRVTSNAKVTQSRVDVREEEDSECSRDSSPSESSPSSQVFSTPQDLPAHSESSARARTLLDIPEPEEPTDGLRVAIEFLERLCTPRSQFEDAIRKLRILAHSGDELCDWEICLASAMERKDMSDPLAFVRSRFIQYRTPAAAGIKWWQETFDNARRPK